MRLKRLFNLKKINLSYALGEIFLVFIGVSMSLALDQWRSGQSEHKVELKLLQEVAEALRNDTLQIARIIEKAAQVKRDAKYTLDHLKTDDHLTDSLSHRIASTMGIDSYIQDNSGFETLKTSGLSLIEDDSIRISLTRTMLLNDQLEEFGKVAILSYHSNQIIPLFNNTFDKWEGYIGVYTDFKKLKSNSIFKNNMYWWYTINSIHLGKLQTTNDQIKLSLTLINQFLEGND